MKIIPDGLISYIKGSLLGWFCVAIISICVCLLDKWANSGIILEVIKNYFSICFTLFSVLIALYSVLTPFILSIFSKLTLEKGLEGPYKDLVFSIKGGLIEVVCILLLSLLSLIFIKSDLPGPAYSNLCLEMILMFCLFAVCNVMFDGVRMLLQLAAGLIDILLEHKKLSQNKQSDKTQRY